VRSAPSLAWLLACRLLANDACCGVDSAAAPVRARASGSAAVAEVQLGASCLARSVAALWCVTVVALAPSAAAAVRDRLRSPHPSGDDPAAEPLCEGDLQWLVATASSRLQQAYWHACMVIETLACPVRRMAAHPALLFDGASAAATLPLVLALTVTPDVLAAPAVDAVARVVVALCELLAPFHPDGGDVVDDLQLRADSFKDTAF
jgi:hypothetical protein